MNTRFIRLGIDYGTSTSKLVFRDPLAPGGEKAYVIFRDGSFRIPSSIAFTGRELIFGCAPEQHTDLRTVTWFQSVKMRVAGEVTGRYEKFCYGPLPRLPEGFTAEELAALSVWFLISEAEKAVCQHLGLPQERVKLSVTLGIPMNFFEHETLRKTFLRIARFARKLHEEYGQLVDGAFALSDARELIRKCSESPEDLAVRDGDVRNWIRPESEAAMCPTVKSPAVSEGPYAEVDVGAGTSHATYFSILPTFRGQRWLKERLCFYGTRSEAVGMDAIDAALAAHKHLPKEECLHLRGQERAVIAQVGKGAINDVLDKIRENYVLAWRPAVQRLRPTPPELEKFRNHDVFVIGGGSLVPEVKQVLQTHPDGYEHRLRLRDLGVPNDLFRTDMRQVSSSEMPFLSVAYGLTYDAAELPRTYTPDQIPPGPPPRGRRLDWEEM